MTTKNYIFVLDSLKIAITLIAQVNLKVYEESMGKKVEKERQNSTLWVEKSYEFIFKF